MWLEQWDIKLVSIDIFKADCLISAPDLRCDFLVHAAARRIQSFSHLWGYTSHLPPEVSRLNWIVSLVITQILEKRDICANPILIYNLLVWTFDRFRWNMLRVGFPWVAAALDLTPRGWVHFRRRCLRRLAYLRELLRCFRGRLILSFEVIRRRHD